MAQLSQVACAKEARESKKGEDGFAICLPTDGKAPAAFAIFDGHSGKEAARICSETVCQRLLAKGPPFEASAIADALWAVDEEVGTLKLKDGATAQIFLVEPSGDKLKCTMAWCGDSSSVVADVMQPLTGPRNGNVLYATESHTAGPDHQDSGRYKEEKVMLEFYGAVRNAVEAEGVDTQKVETTADMVRAAITKVGKPVDEEQVALLVRAFRRGKIIAETTPEGCHFRKKVYVRQRDKEHDVNQVWVVSTADKRFLEGGQKNPEYSDLQMTRSVGDWRASDMVLPNPQIHTFEVPADGIYRVVLASDGLWDVCDFSVAAHHMATHATVESTAKRLLGIAELEYLNKRGHEMMDDDTTVLVVELNPAGTPFVPQVAPGAADANTGGCCQLM